MSITTEKLQELQSIHRTLTTQYQETHDALNNLLGWLKCADCPPGYSDIEDAWKEHNRLTDTLDSLQAQLDELDTRLKALTPTKFYFTYGTSGQPFVGGWTEVEALTCKVACQLFRAFHPDKTEGLLNCSSVYDAQDFESCDMYVNGNFGAKCHEVIRLTRELVENDKEVR